MKTKKYIALPQNLSNSLILATLKLQGHLSLRVPKYYDK